MIYLINLQFYYFAHDVLKEFAIVFFTEKKIKNVSMLQVLRKTVLHHARKHAETRVVDKCHILDFNGRPHLSQCNYYCCLNILDYPLFLMC